MMHHDVATSRRWESGGDLGLSNVLVVGLTSGGWMRAYVVEEWLPVAGAVGFFFA